MGIFVTMPQLGSGMQSAKISSWCLSEGSVVREGDDLLVIETEKIASRMEAPADGVLQTIVAPEGAEVPVGATLAVIVPAGETGGAGA